MNKTALKNFATQSRRKLIEQVQTKALLYGIDENNGLNIEEQFGQLLINGQTYPLSLKSVFKALQKQLGQKGYKQLLEEVAYTWFNRIIAIRYMEVHEYLPERVNVLSSSAGRVDPDILFEYDTMDLTIKQEEVRELINAGNTEAAYRILFVAQCNALNRNLPFMFEPIQDYTELLLPDFLLDAESVIKTLVQSEELAESFTEIEVIGWLYQYYIAEEKDRVFAQKSKYKKEEIPFATQLFTPKWIVQYMVQNSLGRYWTEAHREDEDLIDNWEYFIKHEEEDFHEKIAPYVNKELKVEDIKLLDPAMGSGHILVYAFEVFYEIYEKCGYPERDIPRLILENNLYGLDIDDRAYQLAAFAVVMKAAQYSRRFLRSVEREGIQLNLASIQETNHVSHISEDLIAYIAQQEVGEQYNQVKAFFDQYYNAKTYGSLVNITEREIAFIEERFNQIENNPVEDLFYDDQHEIAKQILPALIHQTKIMRNEYDIVVMNPPYMGSAGMGRELGWFLKDRYSNSKHDLFAAFMEVDHYLSENGFYSAINQQAWMFLSKFEKLRKSTLEKYNIDSLVHLGARAFEEISGEVVQSVAIVLRKRSFINLSYKSTFIDLRSFNTSLSKANYLIECVNKIEERDNLFILEQTIFSLVPGNNIVYWASNYKVFEMESLRDYFISGGRNKTHNNARYVRMSWEIENNKWISYQNGGFDKRFYGNDIYVVDWSDPAKEFYKSHGGLVNEKFLGREGVTWSLVTSGIPGFRIKEYHSIYSSGSPTIFLKEENEEALYYIMGYLNSSPAQYILNMINPTLNLPVGDVLSLPFPKGLEQDKKTVIKLVDELLSIYKDAWDIDEISKDFKSHPIVNNNGERKISNVFQTFSLQLDNWNEKIKGNQVLLDKIFSGILDIDKVKNDYQNYLIKVSEKEFCEELTSYFMGVVLGRYNLKGFNVKTNTQGLLVLTEKSYFEQDVFRLFRKFLILILGDEYIDENLAWIANRFNAADIRDSEDVIRDYFLDDFFGYHCKKYQNSGKQKLPIYWLVDSGKQKGLRTLIYMHSYEPDTMATIRFEHLQEIQMKYQQEIADLENRLVNPNLSATDKKKLNAEKVAFEKKMEELREFDKRLAEFATAALPIDLDDGVKVNYEKFYRGGKGVLAKIK